MRKLLLVPIALLAFIGCGGGGGGSIAWHKSSFADALAEAGKRDTLVMIDFYTDW